MSATILQGDVLAQLAKLPDESVQCCVTSPPYWGLRDYGTAKWEGGDTECSHAVRQNPRVESSTLGGGKATTGHQHEGFKNQCPRCGAIRIDTQLGLERTPDEYVAKMVEVFREVRRVLRSDGTLWLNLGDSYTAGGRGGGGSFADERPGWDGVPMEFGKKRGIPGLKAKDLCGIPWLCAFALRADGWWLRQDIIWSKPNPMPESVTDRCTKAHEYLFLLTKSARYYFDQNAIREPLKDASIARLIQDVENQQGSDRVPGKTNGNMKAVRFGGTKYGDDESEQTRTKSGKEWTPKQAGSGGINDNRSGYFDKDTGEPLCGVTANKKSVWTITTQPYSEAHFATFPPKLVEPCILAGSREADTVLDPFSGAGTTGLVALRLGRSYIGVELNPEYVEMSKRRIEQDAPMFNTVTL